MSSTMQIWIAFGTFIFLPKLFKYYVKKTMRLYKLLGIRSLTTRMPDGSEINHTFVRVLLGSELGQFCSASCNMVQLLSSC